VYEDAYQENSIRNPASKPIRRKPVRKVCEILFSFGSLDGDAATDEDRSRAGALPAHSNHASVNKDGVTNPKKTGILMP